jgi:hypothetical protein
VAPAGAEVDGASIPAFLWSGVGSPFVGDYRRATVVHDVECERRQEPHRAVHRMFYEAMLCDGVEAHRAKTMYFAVRVFGPKWTAEGAKIAAPPSDADLDRLERALDVLLDEGGS